MEIGTIDRTSLSYILQLLNTGLVCNAARFNNKANPFVRLIMKTLLHILW